MEVTIISTPNKFNSEIPLVVKLFQAGLMTFHLRKNNFSTKKLSEYLEAIPSQYHNRIVIHSHHKLALKYQLKGIHITKHHRRNKLKNWTKLIWLRLRRPKLSVTRSFHQLETLLENKKKYKYVFINPYFSKIDMSKNSFDVNKNYLKTVIAKSACPVYASGNITDENYPLLQDMGLAGFSLSKSIWNKSDGAVAAFEHILQDVNTWK